MNMLNVTERAEAHAREDVSSLLYQFDLNGYVIVEDALEPALLAELNDIADGYERRAGIYQLGGEGETQDEAERLKVRFSRIVLDHSAFLRAAMNPKVTALLPQLIVMPRMKSTWLDFAGTGGSIHYHSNHVPIDPVDLYAFDGGRIVANLVTVCYALRDVPLGGAALDVIPGSHKANFRLPDEATLTALRRELPLKAGSALVFSHDMHHGSSNRLDYIRRCLFSSFSTGSSANSQGEDGLYDKLFAASPEGSWQRYLLRRPKGDRDSYPMPEHGRWEETTDADRIG